jgi:hypothetical protein
MDLRIQIDQAQGRQAAGLFFDAATARQLRGNFSVRLDSTGISPADLVTDAQIVLPLMELRRQVLTRDLTLRTRVTANRMTVQRLSGGFAQGRVDASGYVSFDHGSFGKLGPSEIHFVVQRLNAKQLVSSVDPELEQYIDGDVSYRGTAIYQQGIQTRGTATINDAAMAGIPIRKISGDVRVRIDNRGQFRSLIANDLHGNGVGGTLFGDLSIHARDRFAIHTSGRLQGGRLEELSKALGFPRIAGSGKFDANFKLHSTGVVSLQSLTGGVQVDFKNGDVGSVPILSLLNQFVPLTQFASTDFQHGRMRALIAKGQFRIRDLVLGGDAFSLLANGTAALNGSSLNIDAVLQTGGGAQQRLIQTALERLLVGVAPPISAINQVNELLRNRSLFLHVGGSPSRPVIQAKTGPTAVNAFLQNFARGLMGIPGFND